MDDMTWWKELLELEMVKHGETWDDVVSHTMTEEELMREFDSGFGSSKGCPFTVWTENSVYFPAVFDGFEWVGRVSRHPDGKPTEHIGDE